MDSDSTGEKRGGISGGKNLDRGVSISEFHQKLGLEMVAMFMRNDNCYDIIKDW